MKLRPALKAQRLVFENPHISYHRSGDCIAALLYTITVYHTRWDSIFTNRGLGVGGGGGGGTWGGGDLERND